MKFISILLSLVACVTDPEEPHTEEVSQQSGGTGHFDDVIIDGTGSAALSVAGGMAIGGAAPSATAKHWIVNSSPTTTTQLYVSETDTNHTAYEAINIVADQRATFDTSGLSAPASANALTVLVSSTRASGAQPLVNTGIICAVGGGDENYCLLAGSGQGKIRVDDGASLGPTEIIDLDASGEIHINGSAGSTFYMNSGATFTGNVSFYGVASFGGNVRTSGNTVWFTDDQLTELYIFAEGASSNTNQNINAQAGGTGTFRVNSNTGGVTHAGTGGLEVYGGNNDSSPNGGVTGPGVTWGQSIRTGGASGPTWTSGSGSPEGVVTCPVGCLYTNTSGSTSTTLYVKTSGTGNTGWTAK